MQKGLLPRGVVTVLAVLVVLALWVGGLVYLNHRLRAPATVHGAVATEAGNGQGGATGTGTDGSGAGGTGDGSTAGGAGDRVARAVAAVRVVAAEPVAAMRRRRPPRCRSR